MNKYIKTDIEQGLQYLKTGVMNALALLESGENEDICLEGPIALKFIINCAEERGWETDPDMNWDWTDGWEVYYWYRMVTPNKKFIDIDGSLLCGDSIHLKVNHDGE